MRYNGWMSVHVLKRHNKILLFYHVVCPAKHRRKIFAEDVENTLKKICLGIEERHKIHFVEIRTDADHVHCLIQSVPVMLPKMIVQIIKSIAAREIFRIRGEVKTMLWGG